MNSTTRETDDLPLLFAELGIPTDYGTDPYIPRYRDAVELVDVGADIHGRQQRLAPATAMAWQRMREAAAGDRVTLYLVSGFRSHAYQAELIRAKLKRGLSIARILEVNAAPGHSQHHTGMALDLGTESCTAATEDFAATGAFDWLTRHAASFGFNMPYPSGNRFGFCYEPWHWSQVADDACSDREA